MWRRMTVAGMLLAAPGLALSQAYPVKPVRILVGFAAGGGVDIGARIVANGLADHWGTTLVVENRAGAAVGIATETTAGATPDGYTLMLCQIGSHAITPALADTMGGQMQMVTGNLPGGVLSAIRAGRIHALGVTSAKRSVRVPEVPTIAEQGVPGYDVSSWYGICTQAAVPGPILARLNKDLVTVLGKPDVRNRLLDQGIEVAPSTMAQFTAHIRAETAKWSKVVGDANLYAE